MTLTYDYVVIGGGPAGLSLAWYLTQLDQTQQKTVLILEREASLGGCHRVRRTPDGYFTEHGPRIYSSAYLNFRRLLGELGSISSSDQNLFQQMFTPYRFNMINVGGQGMLDMNWWEIGWLGWAYLCLLFWPTYGLKQSVADYGQRGSFSGETMDYLDRICRLTDGAGADRYTLYEFLQLANQNAFYSILQPTRPNDRGLFVLWEQALRKTGRIQIKLEHEVIGLIDRTTRNKKPGQVIACEYQNAQGHQGQVRGKKFILALPPEAITKLLAQSTGQIPRTFGNYRQFEQESRYITYIPITFHWRQKLQLPSQWGFAKNDWGLVYIVLTDYMQFDGRYGYNVNDVDEGSQTVISACLTRLDRLARRTGQTAHQSEKQALLEESFQQLQESYPGIQLPRPDRMILSPGIHRTFGGDGGPLKSSVWKTQDSAFILTPSSGFLSKFHANLHSNLWQVGTQNGHSRYEFTSLEAAVSNVLALLPELIVNPKERTKDFDSRTLIKSGWTILGIIRLILILVLMIWYFIK